MENGLQNRDELRDLIAQASQTGSPEGAVEEEWRAPRTKQRAGFLAVLMVVLVTGTAWISIEANREPNPFSNERVQNDLRAMMYIAITSITEHRQEYGIFPEDLESIGADEEGLVYRTTGDGFELVAELPQRNIEISYRSGEDLTPFLVAIQQASGREQA